MAYTDIAYCDAEITSPEWVSSSDPEKQSAIDIGELWIDKNYSCVAELPVQEEIQRSNAMLADLYVKNALFSPSSSSTVTSNKKIKVGSIEIDTEYQGGGKRTVNLFAEIDFLLSVTCPVNPESSAAFNIVRA